MTSAVARGQGLPLWAVLLALIQNQISMGFPDETAPMAKPAAGYERARSSSRIPLPPTRRELLPPIPKRSASRPATALHAAGLAFDSLLAG
jgi:hypothetical protein